MGRKDYTSCRVESLGIGTILEDFHSAGSWPVLGKQERVQSQQRMLLASKQRCHLDQRLSGVWF